MSEPTYNCYQCIGPCYPDLHMSPTFFEGQLPVAEPDVMNDTEWTATGSFSSNSLDYRGPGYRNDVSTMHGLVTPPMTGSPPFPQEPFEHGQVNDGQPLQGDHSYQVVQYTSGSGHTFIAPNVDAYVLQDRLPHSPPLSQGTRSSTEYSESFDDNSKHVCIICEFKFKGRSARQNLLRHMRHSKCNPNPHQETCEICGKKLGRSDALKNHKENGICKKKAATARITREHPPQRK